VNLGETNREFLDAAWNAASVGATTGGNVLTFLKTRLS